MKSLVFHHLVDIFKQKRITSCSGSEIILYTIEIVSSVFLSKAPKTVGLSKIKYNILLDIIAYK